MGLYVLTDTICALATPPGTGAIAVIRISGTDTFRVLPEIFTPVKKSTDIGNVSGNTIHQGLIHDGAKAIDQVLVSIFRRPYSYTGEDVAEISCHGSPFIQQQILELLIRQGLRLARPGEFTLRSFVNGKRDLSEAEAVADLIAARSETSRDLALGQVRGGFSKTIAEMRSKLLNFASLIELELDFSEEQVEFADRRALLELLEELLQDTGAMVDSFRLGNVIRNGIPVAIIGRPNVGKSTLLNAILNEERAIVSDLPGTTRDAIEDTIVIGGYSFRFIDTAGLRESDDLLENIGIEKTHEKIREASVILYVFDVTQQDYNTVQEELAGFGELTGPEKHLILVGNKTDELSELPHGFREFVTTETVFVSAKRKENIHLLAEHLRKTVAGADITDPALVANSRHYEALLATHEALAAIIEGINAGLSGDLLSTDIHTALYHLGTISGEITTDEILGNIFGKFCIGK